MSPRDIVLALVVVIIWGVNFVAIRWGVDEVPPLLLSALRFLLAAVPAVFFVKRPKVSLFLLVAYGLTIGVGQFGLLFASIKLGMPAGLSSLVIQLQVFFTIGLAVLFLGERPKPVQLAGALVAFAGIGVIAAERLAGAALLPLGMTVLAALSWSFGNIVTKKVGKIDMFGFVVWSSLVPPIPLYLLSLVIEGPEAITALTQMSWVGGGSLLLMAYGATLCGYGLWGVLLSRYPASVVSPLALLVPVAGIGSAMLLLGETISGGEIWGSVLVFAGLLLNVIAPRLLGGKRVRPAA